MFNQTSLQECLKADRKGMRRAGSKVIREPGDLPHPVATLEGGALLHGDRETLASV